VLVGGLTNLHSDTVVSLAFSPDSRMLLSGGADRMARVVDILRGYPMRVLEGHTGHVLAVGWKADNATVATAGADLVVKFWDAVTGEKRKQVSGFEREVTGLAFLSGDQWIASGSLGELRIVNESGERVRVVGGLADGAQSLAVSLDSRWIAAGGDDGVLRVWDRESEKPKIVFEGQPPALSASIRKVSE
jgi:WD40 repeat protein